jgi:transcriptional regulator GlxA family with amidase domain
LRLRRRLALDPPVIANSAWTAPSVNQHFTGSARDVALLTELNEYIQIHLREPLSLPQLAAHAKLSPTHLNRIFHHNLDSTVMRYVTGLRLESARQIICSIPQLAIKEVMSLVGYNDLTHFSRAFSRAYGLSPRDFRNQQKERSKDSGVKPR